MEITLEDLNVTEAELDAIEANVLASDSDLTADDLDRNYLTGYILSSAAVADGMETEAEYAEWYYADGDRSLMIERIAANYKEWRVDANYQARAAY